MESKFSDLEFAKKVYEEVVKRNLAVGVSSADRGSKRCRQTEIRWMADNDLQLLWNSSRSFDKDPW